MGTDKRGFVRVERGGGATGSDVTGSGLNQKSRDRKWPRPEVT